MKDDVLERTERLGSGASDFRLARAFVLDWGLQRGAGIDAPDAPVAAGMRAVLVLAAGPARFRAPVRVTEVIDEPDRAGFAYETLPGHPEDGIERFIVTQESEEVRLTISARSRPGRWFTRIGAPFARRAQRRVTDRYFEAAKAAVANG